MPGLLHIVPWIQGKWQWEYVIQFRDCLKPQFSILRINIKKEPITTTCFVGYRLYVWLFNGLNFQIKHTFGRTHKTASTANACFRRAGVNQYSNLTFTHPKGNTIENRFALKPCIGAYLPQYSEECSFSIYGE